MDTTTLPDFLLDKTIAVIGGGPGGLTLARLLQLKGATVKVYERDYNQQARVQGAIVDLHYDSGLKAIEAAGLLEAFKESYMRGADNFRVLDAKGNILLDEASRTHESIFGDPDFRPEIDRGALRDLLIAGLLPDSVVWDSQLLDMQKSAGKWTLLFNNGSSAVADIVIGADGYRSKIRSYLSSEKAIYSGATIIQGEIDDPANACPEMLPLLNGGTLMAMGEGATIAAQPRGDGGLTFYAASMYPENWAKTSGIDFTKPEQVRTYLQERYTAWNPVFFILFEGCHHFVCRPLNYFPLDNGWNTQATITLLGDAAHLMPPNGEGVNLAMQDALDLSECITSKDFNTLYDAMAAYEKIMLQRAAPICSETIEGIRDFAAPDETSLKNMIERMQ